MFELLICTSLLEETFLITETLVFFLYFILVHSNTFTYIANSFELRLFFPVHQVLMRYTNNHNNSNSIINLMFL